MIDIELNNIGKTYFGAKEPALKDINISVDKGTILTLLGPSGCGKTTTLRLIAGFERADKGEMKIGGKVVSDQSAWVPPEKRGVGMVFQDYALFPHLNVFDNVAFGYKEKDKNARIAEVLKLVNLSGYENRRPHELSGGQQQRVALARALARRPVVVLLDEPFSNLDADLRVQMRVEIKRIIKDSGTTAIFVSHDQKDALAISDKVVVMKEGEIQQIGTPREIYQYPENRFVATFVGQTNILAGTINDDKASVRTAFGVMPCSHTHDLSPGEYAFISIRPDSLELDDSGEIEGKLKEFTYSGDAIDAVIIVETPSGECKDLLVHIHPEKVVDIGENLRFKVIPDFVAVIRQN